MFMADPSPVLVTIRIVRVDRSIAELPFEADRISNIRRLTLPSSWNVRTMFTYDIPNSATYETYDYYSSQSPAEIREAIRRARAAALPPPQTAPIKDDGHAAAERLADVLVDIYARPFMRVLPDLRARIDKVLTETGYADCRHGSGVLPSQCGLCEDEGIYP